jgi:ankyrin repeat protein
MRISGADLNMEDGDGDTPLHLALGGRQRAGGNDPVGILLYITKQRY